VVDIAGLPMLVDAEAGVRSQAVDHLLGTLPDSSESPRLRISFVGDAPDLPDRRPDEVRDRVSVWRQGDTLVALHPGGLVAVADNESARIAGEAERPTLGFRHLFQVVATHILAYHDRFLLHGGAISSRKGSYLVLGPTGAGKSSLTVAALTAGWQVLADDLIVLRSDSGRLTVTGIPRPWVVPSDLAKQVGLATKPAIGDGRGRRVVDGIPLMSGWVPVAGTLLVAHGDATTPPEALASVEALKAVLGSFFCAGDQRFLQRLFPIGARLARLPAWTVRHPADLAARIPAAVHNLSALDDATPQHQ
jgi:hypothetical protein